MLETANSLRTEGASLRFPKLIALCKDKGIKLYLDGCKVVMTQRGTFCLVSPVFGTGYYGTFRGDIFFPNRDCTPKMLEQLWAIEERGLDAVAEIGLLTGSCCICGRMLTAEDSIAGGIGPICGGKVGYAPKVEF